jgi:hypothetical protein
VAPTNETRQTFDVQTYAIRFRPEGGHILLVASDP